MLYFSRWKALATLLTALFICALAAPNFRLKNAAVAAEVGAAPYRPRPRSAGRIPHPARGRHQRCAQAEGRVAARRRAQLAAQRARRLHGLTIRDLSVEVRIREESDFQAALTKLRELSQPLGGLLSTTGQRSVEVVDAGNRVIRLTTRRRHHQRVRQVVEQAIQIVERRINEIGTVEPLIQRQGADRIRSRCRASITRRAFSICSGAPRS